MFQWHAWLKFAWWNEWVLSYLMKTMIVSKAVVMGQYTSELQIWDTVAYEPVWHRIMFSNGTIPFLDPVPLHPPTPHPAHSLDGWMEGFTRQLAFSEWRLIIVWWPSSDNRVAKRVIYACKDKDKINKSYQRERNPQAYDDSMFVVRDVITRYCS